MKIPKPLEKLSLSLYIYTILIILWGTWVRISKSGDGCGDSWPLCEGSFLPQAKEMATWIEYSHRLTTGLFGLIVIYLFIRVLQIYKNSKAKKNTVYLIFIFTITEALLGAALVKMGLVAGNDSFLRLFFMSLHQVNSLLLSGFIGYLYLLIKDDKVIRFDKTFYFIFLSFMTIVILGPLASLSTTLYPSEALWSGVMQDLAPGEHWVVKWRILHPLVALLLSASIFFIAIKRYLVKQEKPYQLFLKVLSINVLFGLSTLLMLYPTWMKLVHLSLGHILWLSILNLSLNQGSR